MAFILLLVLIPITYNDIPKAFPLWGYLRHGACPMPVFGKIWLICAALNSRIRIRSCPRLAKEPECIPIPTNIPFKIIQINTKLKLSQTSVPTLPKPTPSSPTQ